MDHRLSVVFDRTNKKPDDAAGYLATPMVVTQIAGPSNGGGKISVAGHAPLRAATADPTGDALAPYSGSSATPTPVNVPAGDFTGAEIGPDAKTNGFTVKLHLADLSAAALASGAGNGSLVWIWRFTNGWQDAAAVASWSSANGWSYGYDDFTVDSGTCGGQGGDKCEIYPGATPIQGSVDQKAGTITLVVPKSVLHPLTGGNDEHGRPKQGSASVGSRFYDGTAFSFQNDSPVPSTQSWMTQLDNTPAFDFLLGGTPPTVTDVGRYRLVISRFAVSPGRDLQPQAGDAAACRCPTRTATTSRALSSTSSASRPDQIAPLKEVKTGDGGWASVKLQPLAAVPSEGWAPRALPPCAVTGQTSAVSARRLISIAVRPGRHVQREALEGDQGHRGDRFPTSS